MLKGFKMFIFARYFRMKLEAAMTVGRRLPSKMAAFKSYQDFNECAKPTSHFEASFLINLFM